MFKTESSVDCSIDNSIITIVEICVECFVDIVKCSKEFSVDWYMCCRHCKNSVVFTVLESCFKALVMCIQHFCRTCLAQS